MKRKKDGKKGMYVIIPFSISNDFAQEACSIHPGTMQESVVMVNVGWISMKEYKMYGLRRVKLPLPENFQVVNNNRGTVYVLCINV